MDYKNKIREALIAGVFHGEYFSFGDWGQVLILDYPR